MHFTNDNEKNKLLDEFNHILYANKRFASVQTKISGDNNEIDSFV